jgi:hypothetical protein
MKIILSTIIVTVISMFFTGVASADNSVVQNPTIEMLQGHWEGVRTANEAHSAEKTANVSAQFDGAKMIYSSPKGRVNAQVSIKGSEITCDAGRAITMWCKLKKEGQELDCEFRTIWSAQKAYTGTILFDKK